MSRGRLALLWASPFREALWRAWALVAAAVVLGMAAAGSAWWRTERAARLAADEQAALQASAFTADAARIHSPEFMRLADEARRLRARGFASALDRVAWAEDVAAALRAERPLRFQVEVGIEQGLPLPSVVQSWYDAQGFPAPTHVAHELRLEVDGLHEEELRRVLDRVRDGGGGEVRLERCTIVRREDRLGLDTRCTLRRHALLAPAIAAAESQAETPS